MKLSITHPQHTALSAIYGPPSSIHMMLMTCDFEGKKVILEGSKSDFEDLIKTMLEEIHEGLCSATNKKALLQLCRKIDPNAGEFA